MVQTTKTRPPAQQPAAEATAIRRVPQEVLDRIEELMGRYSLVSLAAVKGHLARAVILAEGLRVLRREVGGIIDHFMPLMNTALGFKTDRPSDRYPEPYPREVVADCLVEALLRGLYPVNNEFNIIAASCYSALNGCRRLFESIEGISDIRIAPGVPHLHNGQTVVRVALSWVYRGQPGRLVGPDDKPGMPFAVSIRGQGGSDQAIGKAKRKAYKLAYEQVTGSAQTLPDREVGESPEVLAVVATGADLPDRPGLPAREPAPAEVRRRVNDLAAALEMGPEALAAEYAELGFDPQDPSPEGDAALLASLERRAGKESGMGE